MGSVRIKEHKGLAQKLKNARGRVGRRVSATKKNEQRLTALEAVTDLTTQALEIRQVLAMVADKTMEVMDVDDVLIFLLNEESHKFVLEVRRGVSADYSYEVEWTKASAGFDGLNEKVAETAKTLIVEDSGGVATDAEKMKFRVVVPLRSGGRVVGTLHAARGQGKFQADEVALLSCIGNAIGVAVWNAGLHQEMNQALTRLQQSEEKYRALFEGAYDAIWVHDLDGKMLDVNKACEKLTGYSTRELMKKNICQIMPESSQACLNDVETRLWQNQYVDRRCDGEIVKKSGERAVVQVTTSLIMHGDRPIGFQHCGRDVTDERRLQDNIHFYLQQVTRAQEEERKRVARELHDEILQRLIAISRQLEKITSSDALWEESLETVRDFKKQVEVAVQEVRRFSRDLRPSILDDLGLLPALELLADDLERQGITTSFKIIGESRRLMPEAEVMLFRIAQEATANIRRHAYASVAELMIEFRDSKVRLKVKDNGNGFDVPPNAGDMASLGRLGLAGMHERTKLLGGNFKLESRPGKGTIVTVEVPVQVLLAHAGSFYNAQQVD